MQGPLAVVITSVVGLLPNVKGDPEACWTQIVKESGFVSQ